MADRDATFLALVVIAVVAVVGLGLALASLASHEAFGSMMGGNHGGGMGMGGTTTTSAAPGLLEWAVLLLSAAFLVAAAVLMIRTRRGSRTAVASENLVPPVASIPAPAPQQAAPSVGPPIPAAQAAPAAPVPELTLVKLLDEDERRMYVEIREHGGEMLQRDLVALGLFSKPKVTRLLDKLEAKGLVVREAHGMTNRVRLLTRGT